MPIFPLTPLPNIIIEPSASTPQLSNSKHISQNDDYLRFITSPSGQYLASITNRRQLTIFDTNDRSQFTTWSEQNILYIAFSESQQQFAVLTRSPSIKLYEIRPASDGKLKSINLLHERKGQSTVTFYGWVVWGFDGRYVIYAKNQEIVAMRMQGFEEIALTGGVNGVKTQCAPHYLLIDRKSKQLVSMSRAGIVCTYELQFPSAQTITINALPAVKLLQSNRLSLTPITMAHFDQGSDFFIATTTAITQNKQSFYSTYIISKQNITKFWRIQLQPELIVPPLMMQADNVGGFLVGFLKGERSLYVYDVGQIMGKVGDGQETIGAITHRQKIQVPYLLHAITYNKRRNKLFLGTTGSNNQDRIIQTDFTFNCSSIASTFLPPARQFCTPQCQITDSKTYFSFIGGRCKDRPAQLSRLQENCLGSYSWDRMDQLCELRCDRVENSVSSASYGWPQECGCRQNYVWSGKKVSCELVSASNSGANGGSSTSINTQGTNNNSNNNTSVPGSNSTSNNSGSNTSVIDNKSTSNTTGNTTTPTINTNNTTQTTNTTTNNTANPTNNTTNNTNSPNSKPIQILPNQTTTIPQTTPTKPPVINPPFVPSNQTTNKTNSTVPVAPTPLPDNPVPYNIPTEQNNNKNNTATIVLSVLIAILVLIIAITIFYIDLYKKKKLCFKPPLYVEDNQLKESDIRSSQSNPTEKNSQTSTHDQKSSQQHRSHIQKEKSKQLNKIPALESPIKQFNFMDKVNEPIDEFVIQQVISDSIDNEVNQQYNVESERKFY